MLILQPQQTDAMFLFLKLFFILKLHAHTEWHIINSVDNVLYCQFVCFVCWFEVFVFVSFPPRATAVLWNGEREFSVCFHCLVQWKKKKKLFSLVLFCIRKLLTLCSCFFLFLAQRSYLLFHILEEVYLLFIINKLETQNLITFFKHRE